MLGGPARGNLDNLRRAPFGLMDLLRRAQGDTVGAFGFDPSECEPVRERDPLLPGARAARSRRR
jgi:hypothetical protein